MYGVGNMIDPTLTKVEKKQMLKDVDYITRIDEVEIRYYEEKDWVPGYDEDEEEGEWSEYEFYPCNVNTINKVNINAHPYGELKEGDIVLLLPRDTELPDVDKYKIKYQGMTYICETGLQEFQPLMDTFLYYVMVGEV